MTFTKFFNTKIFPIYGSFQFPTQIYANLLDLTVPIAVHQIIVYYFSLSPINQLIIYSLHIHFVWYFSQVHMPHVIACSLAFRD